MLVTFAHSIEDALFHILVSQAWGWYMKHVLFRSLTIFAVLAFSCVALPALAEEIRGEAITAIINGKTLSGYNTDDNKSSIWYFAPDNTVKLRRNNITWPGKWRIDELGRLCIQLRDPYSDAPRKEGCRVLAKEAGKLIMYGMTTDGQRAGETMSIEVITDGNSENL